MTKPEATPKNRTIYTVHFVRSFEEFHWHFIGLSYIIRVKLSTAFQEKTPLILTQTHKMVVVMKFFSAFLTLYLALALTPSQAEPKPSNTDPAAAPTTGAVTPPPASTSGAPTQVTSQSVPISRTGIICSVYAGSPSLAALGIRITVYSTLGTASNCDQASFQNLTLASIKAQLRAIQQPAFVLRGLAHQYLMDVNLATIPNPFISLGNLKFSEVGHVDVSITQIFRHSNIRVLGFSSTEYIPFKLHSQIQYIWNIGRPVHRLVAPNGDRYVMFAFTTQVIQNTTENTLAYIGPLLDLPAGWTYESYLLDKTLTIRTDINNDFATEIVFDGARNMYVKMDN